MSSYRSFILRIVVISISFVVNIIADTPEIVVVCPTYNNERVCLRNIEAVVQQAYVKWSMIIVDDCSTDRTFDKLQTYIKEHNLSHKITLHRNIQRCGALKNLYDMIHACSDQKVIVTYDGDDWFADPQSLSVIAQAYEDPQVWLTYGQYKTYPGGALGICRPIPDDVMKNKSFRTFAWVSSHPRTFRAWLFKQIKVEDLKYKGKWMQVTWDLAIMLPMLEMASNGHVRFIPRVLYVYCDSTGSNDHRHSFALQQEVGRFICSKPKYETL